MLTSNVATKVWRGLGAAIALLLAGCSSQKGDWNQYFQMIQAGLHTSFNKPAISRDQAAAIPYASLGFRVDGSAEQLLVLATDTNGDQLWTAASHMVLLLHDGRLVRSVGLPHDRDGLSPQGALGLPPVADALKTPFRSIRQADFPDMNLYGVTLNCVTGARGHQTLSILGTPIATTRIDENCHSENPRWSFTDNFWVDAASGFVWHSVQHLNPTGTILQIEILRPPG